MKKLIVSLFFLFAFVWVIPAQRIKPKEADALRIMCYNVRNCKGMDDVIDYKRVADVINKVVPDCIAIQELDSVTQRNDGVYALGELAKHTGMEATYGVAIDFQGGKYGVGILSKEKPLNFYTVRLPGREERRVLLVAEFEHYLLCCTHLSLTEEDRELSMLVIKEELRNIKKPLFLAGDMNSTYHTEAQRMLRERFTTLNNYEVPTFSSTNPRHCIDYIYILQNKQKYKLLHHQVIHEPMASDHLPLYVDVHLE